ncbi:MAG: hypothetical protein QM496_22590 [Verrucomicrobiota bacterium]
MQNTDTHTDQTNITPGLAASQVFMIDRQLAQYRRPPIKNTTGNQMQTLSAT